VLNPCSTFGRWKIEKETYKHNQMIQRWWREKTMMKKLRKVHMILQEKLSEDDLQDLSNKCSAITMSCKGDGCGLLSGGLIDMVITSYFKKLEDYKDCHLGEADMTISGIPLSLKKINGPSTLALDWSINKESAPKEHFTCSILILNLKTSQWWKRAPKTPQLKITYNDTMPSGIYIVDKQFCKMYVKLSSNNKTNTLIEKEFVYLMLKRSMALKLFIALPVPNKGLTFDILKAFSE